MLELKNLSKTYRTGDKALHNVTLTVPKGQVMALIGAVEIDPGLNPDKPEPIDTDIFTFNLNELVVGINLIGNALVFTPLRRGR